MNVAALSEGFLRHLQILEPKQLQLKVTEGQFFTAIISSCDFIHLNWLMSFSKSAKSNQQVFGLPLSNVFSAVNVWRTQHSDRSFQNACRQIEDREFLWPPVKKREAVRLPLTSCSRVKQTLKSPQCPSITKSPSASSATCG